MRTPTRVSSSRPSSTPGKGRKSSQPASNQQEEEDIPIDPALLGENGVLDDDLEDAEGEIVDGDVELVTVQRPSNTPQPSHTGSSSRSYDRQVSVPQPRRLPRASSSRSAAARDFDASSVASSLTPVPPRKRGRPPRDRTAALDTPSIPNGHPRANGNAKGKGKSSSAYLKPNPLSAPMLATTSADSIVHVRATRDDFCSFCMGTDDRNKAGEKERMVSCGRCGRSGHPTCLNMLSPKLRHTVMTYDWCCIECKTCEVCSIKGDDHRLMFCDGCDRGWHSYCLNPPLAKPPKGAWHCPKCRSSTHTVPLPRASTSHSNPAISMSSSRKGKGRATELARSMMKHPGRGRKSESRNDIFYDHLPRIKLKPKGKGKERGREPSPPPVVVRLRVSSGRRRQTVEVESEEEKVPFGGVITEQDADTSKTTIMEPDKEAFEKSRRTAEARLGGPPPPQWDPHISIPTSPAPSSHDNSTYTPSKYTPLPASRSLRDRLLQQSVPHDTSGFPFPSTPGSSGAVAPSSVSQKIKTIRFGVYDIDTWYSAPYPMEYQHVPEGRLWLCEFCLKYMKSGFVAGRHRMKCKARHPPGDEIYRDGSVSVFEVDGRKNKIYCQNLCLLAKMFLDHKTLYYDVEPFLFYVMTEVDDLGARFVGYFSKEKRSPDNNVSCIMTLPVRQRQGWGQLLIDFSYLLSKKEGRVGSPEKPLSGLGEVTYRKYWTLSVFGYLRNAADNVSMDDISYATSMTLDDIFTMLKHESMINVHDSPAPFYSTPASRGRGRGRGRGRPSVQRRKARSAPTDSEEKAELPTRYEIYFDREYVEAILRQHENRRYLSLRPERLKYHPFLVTRNPAKPPGALAKATLMASAVRVYDSTPSEVVETPDGEMGNDLERVVAGEDQATLALVAALSGSMSPKRRLMKRESEEVNLEPAKRLRSADIPNGIQPRRSLRSFPDAEKGTPVRQTRGRMNGKGNENGNGGKMDGASESEDEDEEEEEERIEDEDEDGAGDEDAEGEDEEYAD